MMKHHGTYELSLIYFVIQYKKMITSEHYCTFF